MTTYTLQGIGETSLEVYSEVTLEIVVESDRSGYVYDLDSSLSVVDAELFGTRFFQARIFGVTNIEDAEVNFFNLKLDNGFDGDFLHLEFTSLESSAQSYFFSINGDSFSPSITASELQDIDDNGTFALLSDPFAANQNILFSSWTNAAVSEDDTFVDDRLTSVFFGKDGNDTIFGLLGGNTFSGGAGVDTLRYLTSPSGIKVDVANRSVTDLSETTSDRVVGIEIFFGTDFDDTFEGNAKANSFVGLDGFDIFNGGNGLDSVRYDLEEKHYGSLGTYGITLYLQSGYGYDLFGERDEFTSIERIVSTSADDWISGNQLANILVGLGGDDWFFGAGGNDTLRGDAGNDHLYGERKDDLIFGGTGNDFLYGGQDNDTLKGGAGSDHLEGGSGDDIMTGGSGFDVFVFTAKFGNDIITDFDATRNAEKINLTQISTIRGIGDLRQNHLSQVGQDAVIDDGKGNTITLLGVDMNDLHNADFIL